MHDTKRLNTIPIFDVAIALGLEVRHNKCRCFLHPDTNPSLSFAPRSNRWRCFGCQENGDVISLVAKRLNISFNDACEWIEKVFLLDSISNNKNQIVHRQKNIPKAHISQQTSGSPNSDMYEEIISALTLNAVDKSYLVNQRALSPRVVKESNIRSVNDIDAFYQYLFGRFKQEELLSAGLLKMADQKLKRTFWTAGLLIPFYSYGGRIKSLQLRVYNPRPVHAKYVFLNGIDTLLYNEVLLSKLPVSSKLYICEGVPDTLSVLTMNCNAVGVPGAAGFKDRWIELMGQFRIIIAFDNDAAGSENAIKLNMRLKSRGIESIIQAPGPYHDVNEKLIAERSEYE